MDPLLSVEELEAIRQVGESGMVTPVEIYRQGVIKPFDPVYSTYAAGYDPNYDYGDDELSSTLGSWESPDGPITAMNVWILTNPLTKDFSDDDGMLGIANQLTIRFPVGSNIAANDIVKVVAGGREYTVVDVNDDDTWTEWGKASLRRRE
jgi:hypothetical protein